MLLNELKELGVSLDKNAMKQITGGYGGGACRVYNSNGWSGCVSVSYAQYTYTQGSHGITGYCCASCGSGNFSNASPC